MSILNALKSTPILTISVLIGLAVGLVSTYPTALGPTPSLILWAVAGIILGFFVQEKKEIIWCGVLYGVALSFSFLFSRFGGTIDKIGGYFLFTTTLSLVGAVGGIITVFVGSKIKSIFKK